MTYTDLLIESEQKNLTVCETSLESYGGRIINDFIVINKNMTETEKVCVLAEELGHYETSAGDILDYSTVNSKKQERKARLWAADRLISFDDIIKASDAGIRNRYELAEFLNVTEEFIEETLRFWKEKYGLFISYGNYLIKLDPLSIFEQIDNIKESKDEF